MFVPLFLRVEGKRVVVIGGGEIAARKARELARAGADVVVIAPELRADIGDASWTKRAYARGDLHGAWLAFAATDDADVQSRVADEARDERVFVVAVDDLENASAISPAVVRRGPITVAISSAGEAPALTRLLREIIEEILPDDRYVQIARDLRRTWRAESRPMGARFGELVEAFSRSRASARAAT